MPAPSRYSSASRSRPTPRCAWSSPRTTRKIERARENFPLTYLPEEAESLFKEALTCYAAGCFNAFGAMSRRTAQSLFRELGERGKLELFDTLQEIRTLAELDDETFAALRAVLFGSDSDPGRINPTSMPSAPACCWRSCAICCTKPSCARRACCRQ